MGISLQNSKAINQYLQRYAEPEISLSASVQRTYLNVLILPVCNERFDCLDRILKHNLDTSLLVVMVINSPLDHECSKQWQLHNEQHFTHYLTRYQCQNLKNDSDALFTYNSNIDVLLINKNQLGNQISKNQGVGLARKIAADLALQLHSENKVTNPWIFSTDADVELPENYFSIKQSWQQHSAIVNEFEHVTDDQELAQRQFFYDFKLRYYLCGIQYSGSGYDYIPLGSTLVIAMNAYAQVRGFPDRSGAEDFYILNKLNKITKVKYNKQCIVKIQARYSNRVPFGTGPAVSAMDEMPKHYHPKVFILLKEWHQFLLSIWKESALDLTLPQGEELCELYKLWQCEKIFKKSQSQITSENRWQQFVHQWMDAFRSLKAVHFFETYHPRIEYQKLLNHPDFVTVNSNNLTLFIKSYDKI